MVEPDTRRIRSCNPATERIFGYTADELIGRTTEVLHIDREHDRHFGAESERALECQGVYRGKFSMRRRGGGSFPTTCTVASSRDAAGVEAVINIVRDDSEHSLSGPRDDLVGIVAERLWEASDMPGALHGLLKPLCWHFSWACGEAWARRDKAGLRQMAYWAAPGYGLDRHLVGAALPSGGDLVGRVWETERAAWITGSGEHGGDSVDVKAVGTLFAAPVSAGADEPLAVLVFRARHPQAPDWGIQDTTEYIAGLAGPYLQEFARRWAGRGRAARPSRKTAVGIPRDTDRQELDAALQTLSRRERQVLDYLLQGRLTKEIAYELGLSCRTVETYRASLKRKMGARTTAEAIAMLAALGEGFEDGTGR